MTDELYPYALYSYANKPNKSPLRKRLLALLLREIGYLSSLSRSCLGRLILSHNAAYTAGRVTQLSASTKGRNAEFSYKLIQL